MAVQDNVVINVQVQLGQSLQNLQQLIQRLNTVEQRLTALNTVSLANIDQTLQKLKTNLDTTLTANIQNIVNSLNALNNVNFQNLINQINNLQNAVKNVGPVTSSVTTAVKSAGSAAASAAASAGNATSTSFFKSFVGSLNNLFSALNRNFFFKSLSLGLFGGFGVFLAGQIVGGIKQSLLEIEDEYAKLNALLYDQAAGTAKRIVSDMEEIAKKTGYSLRQIMEAAYEALQANVSTDELNDFVETATKLAKIQLLDPVEMVNALTSIRDSFGLTTNEIKKYVDGMMEAINVGKMTISDFSKYGGRLYSMASEIGVSVEEVFSSVATLTRAGITSAQAFTYMSSLLRSLSAPAKEARDKLHELGVVLNENTVRTLGLKGTLQMLMDAIKRSGTTSEMTVLREVLGNINAIRAALALSTNDWELYDEVSGRVIKAINSATSELDVAFTKARRDIQDTANAFKVELQGIINKVAGFSGSAATSLSKFHDVLKAVNETISNIDASLTAATSKAIENLEGITDYARSIVVLFSDKFITATNLLTNIGDLFSPEVITNAEEFGDAIETIAKQFEKLGITVDFSKDAVEGLFDAMRQYLTTTMQSMKAALSTLKDVRLTHLATAAPAYKTGLSAVKESVTSSHIAYYTNLISPTLLTSSSQIYKEVFENAYKSYVNKILSIAEASIDAIKKGEYKKDFETKAKPIIDEFKKLVEIDSFDLLLDLFQGARQLEMQFPENANENPIVKGLVYFYSYATDPLLSKQKDFVKKLDEIVAERMSDTKKLRSLVSNIFTYLNNMIQVSDPNVLWDLVKKFRTQFSSARWYTEFRKALGDLQSNSKEQNQAKTKLEMEIQEMSQAFSVTKLVTSLEGLSKYFNTKISEFNELKTDVDDTIKVLSNNIKELEKIENDFKSLDQAMTNFTGRLKFEQQRFINLQQTLIYWIEQYIAIDKQKPFKDKITELTNKLLSSKNVDEFIQNIGAFFNYFTQKQEEIKNALAQLDKTSRSEAVTALDENLKRLKNLALALVTRFGDPQKIHTMSIPQFSSLISASANNLKKELNDIYEWFEEMEKFFNIKDYLSKMKTDAELKERFLGLLDSFEAVFEKTPLDKTVLEKFSEDITKRIIEFFNKPANLLWDVDKLAEMFEAISRRLHKERAGLVKILEAEGNKTLEEILTKAEQEYVKTVRAFVEAIIYADTNWATNEPIRDVLSEALKSITIQYQELSEPQIELLLTSLLGALYDKTKDKILILAKQLFKTKEATEPDTKLEKDLMVVFEGVILSFNKAYLDKFEELFKNGDFEPIKETLQIQYGDFNKELVEQVVKVLRNIFNAYPTKSNTLSDLIDELIFKNNLTALLDISGQLKPLRELGLPNIFNKMIEKLLNQIQERFSTVNETVKELLNNLSYKAAKELEQLQNTIGEQYKEVIEAQLQDLESPITIEQLSEIINIIKEVFTILPQDITESNVKELVNKLIDTGNRDALLKIFETLSKIDTTKLAFRYAETISSLKQTITSQFIDQVTQIIKDNLNLDKIKLENQEAVLDKALEAIKTTYTNLTELTKKYGTIPQLVDEAKIEFFETTFKILDELYSPDAYSTITKTLNELKIQDGALTKTIDSLLILLQDKHTQELTEQAETALNDLETNLTNKLEVLSDLKKILINNKELFDKITNDLINLLIEYSSQNLKEQKSETGLSGTKQYFQELFDTLVEMAKEQLQQLSIDQLIALISTTENAEKIIGQYRNVVKQFIEKISIELQKSNDTIVQGYLTELESYDIASIIQTSLIEIINAVIETTIESTDLTTLGNILTLIRNIDTNKLEAKYAEVINKIKQDIELFIEEQTSNILDEELELLKIGTARFNEALTKIREAYSELSTLNKQFDTVSFDKTKKKFYDMVERILKDIYSTDYIDDINNLLNELGAKDDSLKNIIDELRKVFYQKIIEDLTKQKETLEDIIEVAITELQNTSVEQLFEYKTNTEKLKTFIKQYRDNINTVTTKFVEELKEINDDEIKRLLSELQAIDIEPQLLKELETTFSDKIEELIKSDKTDELYNLLKKFYEYRKTTSSYPTELKALESDIETHFIDKVTTLISNTLGESSVTWAVKRKDIQTAIQAIREVYNGLQQASSQFKDVEGLIARTKLEFFNEVWAILSEIYSTDSKDSINELLNELKGKGGYLEEVIEELQNNIQQLVSEEQQGNLKQQLNLLMQQFNSFMELLSDAETALRSNKPFFDTYTNKLIDLLSQIFTLNLEDKEMPIMTNLANVEEQFNKLFNLVVNVAIADLQQLSITDLVDKATKAESFQTFIKEYQTVLDKFFTNISTKLSSLKEQLKDSQDNEVKQYIEEATSFVNMLKESFDITSTIQAELIKNLQEHISKSVKTFSYQELKKYIDDLSKNKEFEEIVGILLQEQKERLEMLQNNFSEFVKGEGMILTLKSYFVDYKEMLTSITEFLTSIEAELDKFKKEYDDKAPTLTEEILNIILQISEIIDSRAINAVLSKTQQLQFTKSYYKQLGTNVFEQIIGIKSIVSEAFKAIGEIVQEINNNELTAKFAKFGLNADFLIPKNALLQTGEMIKQYVNELTEAIEQVEELLSKGYKSDDMLKELIDGIEMVKEFSNYLDTLYQRNVEELKFAMAELETIEKQLGEVRKTLEQPETQDQAQLEAYQQKLASLEQQREETTKRIEELQQLRQTLMQEQQSATLLLEILQGQTKAIVERQATLKELENLYQKELDVQSKLLELRLRHLEIEEKLKQGLLFRTEGAEKLLSLTIELLNKTSELEQLNQEEIAITRQKLELLLRDQQEVAKQMQELNFKADEISLKKQSLLREVSESTMALAIEMVAYPTGKLFEGNDEIKNEFANMSIQIARLIDNFSTLTLLINSLSTQYENVNNAQQKNTNNMIANNLKSLADFFKNFSLTLTNFVSSITPQLLSIAGGLGMFGVLVDMLSNLADINLETLWTLLRKAMDYLAEKLGKIASSPLASTAGGAIIGGAIGGLPGAIIGGIIGLIVGLIGQGLEQAKSRAEKFREEYVNGLKAILSNSMSDSIREAFMNFKNFDEFKKNLREAIINTVVKSMLEAMTKTQVFQAYVNQMTTLAEKVATGELSPEEFEKRLNELINQMATDPLLSSQLKVVERLLGMLEEKADALEDQLGDIEQGWEYSAVRTVTEQTAHLLVVKFDSMNANIINFHNSFMAFWNWIQQNGMPIVNKQQTLLRVQLS